MDPDFADFLLDESHFDLKQKQVDDADFLEGLTITDNDEEEFLLMVDFEPETRLKMEEEADFDIPFEITSEDLDLLEAQEKEINKATTESKGLNTPKKQMHRRISSTTGNKDTNSPSLLTSDSAHEINKLKVDLELYRDRAESLSLEFSAQKRQILTKEGEITILRQRLIQLDNEKITMAQQYAELSVSSRKNSDKKSENLEKEIKNLKMELDFKDKELQTISSSFKRKIPKSNNFKEDSNLNSLGTIKSEPEMSKSSTKTTQPLPTEHPNVYSSMTDLEIFSNFTQKVDLTWKFSDLKDFDILDIVKAVQFACDEIKISDQSETPKSGKSLARGIVKLFERGLHFRQVN